VNGLADHVLGARDGDAGRVLDLRVDPARFTVSALVADVGRRVLVSSRLLGPIETGRARVPAALTRAELSAAPRVDADRTARSARDLVGHTVLGLDDEIGRVADLLLDDERWAIPYLVVDVDAAHGPRRVLVPTRFVSWTSDETRSVMLALCAATVTDAPEWDGSGSAHVRVAGPDGRPSAA
jgi:hypothetical protein